MATTSGTVAATTYTLRKVIEHAARRGPNMTPQELTAEDVSFATDNVFTLAAQWINAGFPLWTQYKKPLAVTQGSPEVTLPDGTVDIVQALWRSMNPWRGAATTTGGADASTLFAGAPTTSLVIAGPNAGVTAAFGTDTEVDSIGVLVGVDDTAALQVLTSNDGASFTLAQTLTSTAFVAGTWAYFDLDPVVVAPYVQIRRPAAGSWTLAQLNFGLANATEVPLGRLNRDDYYNLPNLDFSSPQPNSVFVDRLYPNPLLRIWPIPNQSAFYNGTVAAVMRRYIQDPGALTNNVEVPARWLEALVWRLASLMMYEARFQDAQRQQLMMARAPLISAEAQKAEMLAWAEERDKSPIRFLPDISAYTR